MILSLISIETKALAGEAMVSRRPSKNSLRSGSREVYFSCNDFECGKVR